MYKRESKQSFTCKHVFILLDSEGPWKIQPKRIYSHKVLGVRRRLTMIHSLAQTGNFSYFKKMQRFSSHHFFNNQLLQGLTNLTWRSNPNPFCPFWFTCGFFNYIKTNVSDGIMRYLSQVVFVFCVYMLNNGFHLELVTVLSS